jgi:hypothetical protein
MESRAASERLDSFAYFSHLRSIENHECLNLNLFMNKSKSPSGLKTKLKNEENVQTNELAAASLMSSRGIEGSVY